MKDWHLISQQDDIEIKDLWEEIDDEKEAEHSKGDFTAKSP